MSILSLLNRYTDGNPRLRHILFTHSRSVADKALAIVDAHPELGADRQFVEDAAMLHDIGIVRTNAPSICCFGTEPYICHGILGAEIVREEGFPEYARVCERHTGTGLPLSEIIAQNLPLPHIDLVPETIEEQIICYADKFFSKTKLDIEKTPDQARQSLAKFGSDSVARFNLWHQLFS